MRKEAESAATTSSAVRAAFKPKEDKKAIRFSAPGLRCFDPTRFLHCFAGSSLSPTDDFDLDDKRERLLEIGLGAEAADRILDGADLNEFLSVLAPDAASALISDDRDFRRVCDFLFFRACSTASPEEAEDGDSEFDTELCRKALLDLLKNYAFRWKLGVGHVLTALDNLGFRTKAVSEERYFDDLFKSRLDALSAHALRVHGKRQKFRCVVPKFLQFYQEKRQRGATQRRQYSERSRLSCLKSFFALLTDLVVSHSDHTTLRTASTSSDWTQMLLFVYVVSLAASDSSLISDPLVARDVQLLLHSQLDQLDSYRWSGVKEAPTAPTGFLAAESSSERAVVEPESAESPLAVDGTSNALGDMSEVLSQVGKLFIFSKLVMENQETFFKCSTFHFNTL